MTGFIYSHIIINVFDLETFEENEKVVPYCVGMIISNKKKWIYYDKKTNIILKALEFIFESEENNYIEIFIHNINFDGLIILDEISKENIGFNLRFNKGNIYFLEVFYLNKIIKFRCSYKIIPLSLKYLGEIENHKKGAFPYKFVNYDTLFYKGKTPNKEYWEEGDYPSTSDGNFDLKKKTIEYCMNDVMLTQKILKNILFIINSENSKIINQCYSSASLSHKLFFLKYNVKKIKENVKKVDEFFIRESYFGGRCEVFGNLKEGEHVKYFDFSGMYGQCMEEVFHLGEGFTSYNSDYKTVGFHKIEYYSDGFYIPVLPCKSENNKLIFANGKNIGVFWFEEILLFEKNGGKVLKVIESFIYKEKDNVFLDFVKKFTEIRKMGGYYKIFGKLMINSLYGSMGLNQDDSYYYITFSKPEYEYIQENMDVINTYEVNSAYVINIEKNFKSKSFIKEKKISENDRSKRNVSYSSAIASKARIKLYEAFKKVKKDGGRLLYCDTDSIFASYAKTDTRESFEDNNWLMFYKDAVFVSPKTYGLKSEKDEIKIKGVKVKDLSFNRLKEEFYTEKIITFKDQLNFQKTNLNLKQLYLEKKIDLNLYDKRIFIKDKKETKPKIINILK